MAKTFVLNIANLNNDADIKKIQDYFEHNLKGIEDLKFELSFKLVTIRYNESVGSPKNILDALDYLEYTVR